MGKQTGFLEYERVENKEIPVKIRIQGYEEFHDSGKNPDTGIRGIPCL